MRLKSSIWIQAYLRTVDAAGVAVGLVRRGDPDGGAIYIKVSYLDGQAVLYGPAPMSMDIDPSDRLFAVHLGPAAVSEREVDAYIAQQCEFDRDLWLVEVEDRQGRHFLDDWT